MKLSVTALILAGTAPRANAGFWHSAFTCDEPTSGGNAAAVFDDFRGPTAVQPFVPPVPGECWLKLTGESTQKAGSAFKDYSLDGDRSFRTTFEYRMFGEGNSDGDADGLAFVIHQDSDGAFVGQAGGYLGAYGGGITNALVIELDSWDNGDVDPFNDDGKLRLHIQTIGNLASAVTELAESAEVPAMRTADDGTSNGRVWVHYCAGHNDGTLKVWINPSGDDVPANPVLTGVGVNSALDAIWSGNDVHMGFTAATGDAIDNHDILSWDFDDGCGSVPKTYDDPHFLTWNNTYFDFMGACDLKLITAPHFHQDLALDIDIRTTTRYGYSYIESAVVKIGESTLEVSSYGSYMLDGVSAAEMPAKIAGFTVEHSNDSKHIHIFEIKLGLDESIVVKTFKDMVSVKLEGADSWRFRGSKGMLGSFDKNGLMLGHDDVTVFDDPNAFAREWQIKSDEPMLFQTRREPQYPQECQLPSIKKESRRLGEATSMEAAEKACAAWPKDMISGCIHDVLSTGDLELALAGAF